MRRGKRRFSHHKTFIRQNNADAGAIESTGEEINSSKQGAKMKKEREREEERTQVPKKNRLSMLQENGSLLKLYIYRTWLLPSVPA